MLASFVTSTLFSCNRVPPECCEKPSARCKSADFCCKTTEQCCKFPGIGGRGTPECCDLGPECCECTDGCCKSFGICCKFRRTCNGSREPRLARAERRRFPSQPRRPPASFCCKSTF